MAKGDASGMVIAAVGAAADRAAAAAPEPMQIDMLPPTRFEPGDSRRDDLVDQVRRDRAGRPPGAKNRTTRQMLDFIRETLGDPLMESARMAMHTPATLARDLACSQLEAAQLLEKIRADLRPYFYAKQAPVDGAGKVVPGLTMQVVAQGAVTIGADGLQRPPWLYQEPDEQNQALRDVSPGASDGGAGGDAE